MDDFAEQKETAAQAPSGEGDATGQKVHDGVVGSDEASAVNAKEDASAPAETNGTGEEAQKTITQSGEASVVHAKDEAAPHAETVGASAETQRTEPPTDEIPAVHAKIQKQVEFYFGDINLARDKFLNAELEKNENWLPIDTLMNFGRVKTLSNNSKETVVNALKNLQSSVIEFNEETMKVRRLPSLKPVSNTPEFWQSVNERSAIVSGFPKEATLDDVKDFCEQHGNVDCVWLRKDQNNAFSGAVCVAFANKEELGKFLTIPELSYKGTKLDMISQKESTANRGNKKRSSPTAAKKPAKRQKKELVRRKGVVLFLDNIPHHTSLKQIHSLCSTFGTIQWVEHQRNSPTATVRFAGEENTAVEIVKKIQESPEGQLKVLSTELKVRTLTDEEEDEYWRKLAGIMTVIDNSGTKAAGEEANNSAENSASISEREEPKAVNEGQRETAAVE